MKLDVIEQSQYKCIAMQGMERGDNESMGITTDLRIRLMTYENRQEPQKGYKHNSSCDPCRTT